MLMLQIPYFIPKRLGKMSIALAVAFLLICVIRGMKGQSVADVDALGSVAEQTEKVQTMFDGIVESSDVVFTEAGKSTEMVGNLYDQTQNVTSGMQEIVDSTQMTAENIEEQNKMTQPIQTAITESNESIQENLRVMNELQEQSKLIADTNAQVNEAMIRLQKKTKEVEEIAGMILGISQVSAATEEITANAEQMHQYTE